MPSSPKCDFEYCLDVLLVHRFEETCLVPIDIISSFQTDSKQNHVLEEGRFSIESDSSIREVQCVNGILAQGTPFLLLKIPPWCVG